MKKIVFEKSAFEDFTDWATTDKKSRCLPVFTTDRQGQAERHSRPA
jgi:hypothetical protein